MKRLIEQTTCEHGKWGNCGVTAIVKHRRVKCPGGSSREVTVDELPEEFTVTETVVEVLDVEVDDPFDFDAIYDRYYETANRRFELGLTYNELWFVVYGEKKEEE